MGWDRDSDDEYEGGSELQAYYRHLGFLRRAGITAYADKLVAGGPPSPRSADGPIGWLAWRCAVGVDGSSRLRSIRLPLNSQRLTTVR